MHTDSFLSLGPHGFHRVAFYDWGSSTNPHVVVCVHGLTRTGRDFDALARALAGECRVVCPDIVGRGKSDWLAKRHDYGYPVYVSDMAALMARTWGRNGVNGFSLEKLMRKVRGRDEAPRIDWVGTSMGGLIGMFIASKPNSPIRRLVVNDIGPFVPAAALKRLASYVGKNPRFSSLEELTAYLRQIAAPFGPLSDAEWRHLALHSSRQYDDGAWGFVYDPQIASALRPPFTDVNLWPVWDQVRCPTLILRGADSDLLLKKTAQEMLTRGPKSQLIEFPGVGHAPTLTSTEQIAAVREFLLA